MTQKFGDGYDWRGTPIMPGQTVIYGAGVGRSIALVEAEVVEVNGARVKLKVVYRAYGGSYRDNVTVGCDRVTVVEKLPPAALGRTASEEVAERQVRIAERKANEATHVLRPEPKEPSNLGVSRQAYVDYYNAREDWKVKPCLHCDTRWYDTGRVACLGSQAVI